MTYGDPADNYIFYPALGGEQKAFYGSSPCSRS